MEIFSMEGWYFLLRWIHFLAGITWIGVLYYFNFIQTPYFATDLGGQARSAMVRGLVPNALWWFRWGAMFTFITGWLIILTKLGHDNVPLSSGYMTRILTGGLMGTLMWANVWFVIWPAQQVVIANAEKVAAGGEANPAAGPRGIRGCAACDGEVDVDDGHRHRRTALGFDDLTEDDAAPRRLGLDGR